MPAAEAVRVELSLCIHLQVDAVVSLVVRVSL